MLKILLIFILLPVFSFAQLAVLLDITGMVKVNGKKAYKNMILKEGDSLEAVGKSKAIIQYVNKAKETLINAKLTLTQARAKKLLKIQTEAEKAKENIAVKGAESVPAEKMKQRQKSIEKLKVLFANGDYSELILFVNRDHFNYQHPDLLFKVGFAYFQVGDFLEAEKLLKQLQGYDIPEYLVVCKTLLQAVGDIRNQKE